MDAKSNRDKTLRARGSCGRAILSHDDAQTIYQSKPPQDVKDRSRASLLAQQFGVSVKTVRDIWLGRTWYRATFYLDQNQPFTPERLIKKPGRPPGAKDRKPRAKKPDFQTPARLGRLPNSKSTDQKIPNYLSLFSGTPDIAADEPRDDSDLSSFGKPDLDHDFSEVQRFAPSADLWLDSYGHEESVAYFPNPTL